ncbi:AGE family epimerase/isomerase [Loktanella sp. R86503]|uniref:AGE family epimerase/isomerase n=1 Tax=Loktanella sp. R86503 TaxID=3093847 RepID=UPI0036DF2397
MQFDQDGDTGFWIDDREHHAFLRQDAQRQIDVFRQMIRPDGGFDLPGWDGSPLPDAPQELHTTTRMVHSFALAKCFGFDDCDAVIDAGMDYIWKMHRDASHGGYFWSVARNKSAADDSKLAYGHMFVLLAAATAKQAGHPDADRLLMDVTEILDTHYWEESHGLYADEFNRDWTPFSTYRGMNANMHGVEAHLAAFEATGQTRYLDRAGRIIDFFVHRMAPDNDWRLPEHYTYDWTVDRDYAGNPMFRPAGTTPGHSLELGRLTLQHWDLAGRPDNAAPMAARRLISQAITDAWRPDGGFIYTMKDGKPDRTVRYWWPVAEAIGALAALIKLDRRPSDEALYRSFWQFAKSHLIDPDHGGWFPELDDAGHPAQHQFVGKPDIYHALQADLLPLTPHLSRATTS